MSRNMPKLQYALRPEVSNPSGGPRIPQNLNNLNDGKNHLKRKNSKNLEICQNQRYTHPSIHPSIGKRCFHLALQTKSTPKNIYIFFDHFQTKMFKSETISFYESLKILDIRLWEVGAIRRLNGTSKVNRQTHRPTDRRTFQLIESIGPEGRCFENILLKPTHLNYPTWFVTAIKLSQGTSISIHIS